MERDGNPREAFAKYRSAEKLLDQIIKTDPSWQPPVVEYRLKKTRDNIARVEAEIAKLPTAADGPEGPLPQVDTIQLPPPAITTSSSAYSPRRPSPETAGTVAVPSGESASLREQLAAARSESQKLKERLARQAAELQSARFEVDKTKVSVVELKAQLAQAQDAMENAIRDREIRAAKAPPIDDKRVAELQREILQIEADSEALTEENGRLLAKLESASKYIDASDAGRKALDTDRKKLARQRDEAVARTKKIKENSAVIERLTQEKDDLEKKFARETVDLQKRLAQEKDDLASKSAEEKAGMKKKFEAEIAGLEAKLAAAPDAALLAKLAAENKDLAARLSKSEKLVAEAAKKPTESEKLLTELRSEINSLNDRLLAGQAQIASREDQIKGLAKQLDESSGEVARLRLNPQPSADEKRTMVENDLLRTIILRQIREQAERDAAGGELEKEIQALQVKSDTIARQMEVLRRPAFQLSDDEKLLFKEPITLLGEISPSSLDVTLVIAKPAGGFPPQVPQTPQTGPESLPEESRDKVGRAHELFERGRFEDAEKLYQQIVESAPNNSFALSNLGVTQIQVRKLSAAEVALKKASAINPKDSFAATNLGVVYCKQGRFDEAISSLLEAVSSDDKDHIAQNHLGICYGEKGQRDLAEIALKKSIEIRDAYPDAHFNLAVLYATSEPPRLDLAKEHYQKALEHGSEADASLEQLFPATP